jgi:hypothetical protein
LKLVLIRERSLATPRSRTDITTFGKGEKFRIPSKSSSAFDMGLGSSTGHVLHLFLLALHTNLAADVAKLGVCRARPPGGGGGDTGGVTGYSVYYNTDYI